MARILSVLFAALTFASFAVAQQSPQPTELQYDNHEQFRELLEALPEESLHSALQLHPKFRDGVYPKYKSAVAAVHQDDPPLATRLLAVAALDLLKRQNGTSPTAPKSAPTSENKPPTSPTSATAVVVPVVVSTTNAAGSTVARTTSAVASPSVSVAVAVTTTNSKGKQVVTSSMVAGAIVVSDGQTTTSPVPEFVQPTSGQPLTTTDARGNTLVTTFTPGGGEVSSLVLSTTTLPDGSKSTITSFAVVQPESSGASGASGTPSPHLQSGAVPLAAVNSVAVVCIGAPLGAVLLI